MVIVNHYAVARGEAGITRHADLAHYLAARGHRVTIVAANFDHASRSGRITSTHATKPASVEGVVYRWLPVPGYRGNGPLRVLNMVAFGARVYALSDRDLFSRADIVIGSSPHLLAALAAERAAARVKARYVLEVRDLWPESLVQIGGMPRGHLLVQTLGAIERYLYARADAIVSVLPSARAHIEARGGRGERVHYVPNGIALDTFGAPSQLKPPSSDFTIAYAGSHAKANALDIILDAAGILLSDEGAQRVRFRFIGSGPEKPRLMERARREGLTNVAFESAVAKAQVGSVLAGVDACVHVAPAHPMYRFGLSPNKLFDYLAAARPVVLGVEPEANPLVGVDAGVMSPPQPASLAAAVRTLVAMPHARRQQLGRNGRLWVEKNHDSRMLALRLEETLMAALAGRGVSDSLNRAARSDA